MHAFHLITFSPDALNYLKMNKRWGWQCSPRIPALGRGRPKDEEFKLILSYLESLKIAWAT